MENNQSLLEMALQLKPQDRFLLIEGLIRSLDEPNKDIDEIWTKEAVKRLQSHREGRTRGIPYNKVFEE